MRGKVSCMSELASDERITPAHAGKSSWKSVQTSEDRDHPRTCGEKSCIEVININDMGSPPHMRGKVRLDVRYVQESGITPAHAGKSCTGKVKSTITEDHPRTCGEKFDTSKEWLKEKGSPPHMRGKGRLR